jgi:acetyl esterase/lipase
MPSSNQSSASGPQTLSRLAELYNPNAQFEVKAFDVEYRNDGSRSWLARIYQPQASGPFPALLEIHGGAWNRNDRLQNAPLDEALAASGIVVAAIDFRQGHEEPYPASIADTNYGTRWLKLHAGDFNATAEGLGTLGLSSGGHINMLAAMRPHDPRYTALPLEGGADVDGSAAYVLMGWPVLDPLARYHHARAQGKTNLLSEHHNYFVDEAGMTEANCQLILERGEKVETPPALLFQGADDDVLAPRTAEKFVEAYGKAGGIIELALFPHANHGYSREGGPNTARTVDVLKSFIARQLAALSQGY